MAQPIVRDFANALRHEREAQSHLEAAEEAVIRAAVLAAEKRATLQAFADREGAAAADYAVRIEQTLATGSQPAPMIYCAVDAAERHRAGIEATGAEQALANLTASRDAAASAVAAAQAETADVRARVHEGREGELTAELTALRSREFEIVALLAALGHRDFFARQLGDEARGVLQYPPRRPDVDIISMGLSVASIHDPIGGARGALEAARAEWQSFFDSIDSLARALADEPEAPQAEAGAA